MDSERVVVSAPMSFSGARQRAVNWLWRDKHPGVKWGIGLWAVPLLLALWWLAIACWYVVFGLFLAPYRLLRRNSRKRKRDEARHREIVEAQRDRRG